MFFNLIIEVMLPLAVWVGAGVLLMAVLVADRFHLDTEAAALMIG